MKFAIKFFKYTFLTLMLLIIGVCIFNWENDIPVEELMKKYANAESQFEEIDGMKVHIRDQGNPLDSIPIVLIHGGGSSLHTWESWVDVLKKEHRVITFDLPGLGLTGPNPTGDYSQEYCVSFVEKLLKKLSVKHCILGGSSMGGAITWQYSLSHSSQVQKLILIDADGIPDKSKTVPIVFKLAKIPVINLLFKYLLPRSAVENSLKSVYVNQDKVTPKLIDRYFDLALREGNRQALLDRMKQTSENSKYLEIKNLKIPTLIIWGEKDAFIKLDIAEKFHSYLPNDTLVIFKGLGHTPMEEDPINTVNIVREFLKIN
jgi:pimeloyl-ACP methyl ester carboxylesterase